MSRLNFFDLSKFRHHLGLLLVGTLISCYGRAQVKFEVAENRTSISVYYPDSLFKPVPNHKAAELEVLLIYAGITGRTEAADPPAILGNYQGTPGKIVFTPIVPFSRDLSYLAVFGDTVEYHFRPVPDKDEPGARLLRIYPTEDTVPENLLKIYLTFSKPMREGEVYKRVTITDENGKSIENPFVHIQPELWDSTAQRITIWFDPGRVKRSLQSRELHGPVLTSGNTYHLRVDSLWKDVQGRPLINSYKKRLIVTDSDRKRVLTDSWQIHAPEPYSKFPLIIKFDEVMDYATALNSLSVWTSTGEILTGEVAVGSAEREWKFIPGSNWKPGIYNIRILSTLEDLAGNNLNRLFDVDLSDSSYQSLDRQFTWIQFEILSPE